MRVLVVHNPNAGGDEEAHAELHHALVDAGHVVAYERSGDTDLLEGAARAHEAEVVVAAGGDGTVGAVFCALAGTGLAVTIVPLGTANNIASALGLAGVSARDLVRGWPHAERRGFDLLSIRVGSTTRCGVESFGGGMIAALVTGGDQIAVDLDVATARDALHRLAGRWSPEHWDLEIDGVDHSGAYLAVHAMNIPAIGPNLAIAPAAATDDGVIDVVLIGSADREPLRAHLASAEHDWSAGLTLRTVRGRELRGTVAVAEPLVIDDAPIDTDDEPTHDFVVGVAGDRVQLLVPGGGDATRARANERSR